MPDLLYSFKVTEAYSAMSFAIHRVLRPKDNDEKKPTDARYR
jgi:hypothetical protein